MTAILASVRNVSEAAVVLQGDCDIIDIKEPDQGALGAVSAQELQAIVERVASRRRISATVGDIDAIDELQPAIAATAASGVDIVKVGLFSALERSAVLNILQAQAGSGTLLVAVLFAENGMQLDWLPPLADAGLYGVMLDTARKADGGLCDKLSVPELQRFTGECRRLGLYCGLAGSLRAADIDDLLPLQPDYLGFRGALCDGAERSGELSVQRLREICQRVKQSGQSMESDSERDPHEITTFRPVCSFDR